MSHGDRKASAHPKHEYLYSSEDNDDGCVYCPDKNGTIFATFTTPKVKKNKRTPKKGIMPAEQNPCVQLCVFVPDRELDCLTESHIKLNVLDDTQKHLINSHQYIAFDYVEDTVSLVKESTLTTSEISLSDNSDSSAGNASIALKYYCYEIEADAPQFKYHRPKIKILKQELPVTICTVDTIGNIQSQRLFQVQFDLGSNVSMIKRSALPKGVTLSCLVIPSL